ncbi:hypothetical protein BDW66DRAFT_130706 [Aspergillus desertorum]
MISAFFTFASIMHRSGQPWAQWPTFSTGSYQSFGFALLYTRNMSEQLDVAMKPRISRPDSDERRITLTHSDEARLEHHPGKSSRPGAAWAS